MNHAEEAISHMLSRYGSICPCRDAALSQLIWTLGNGREWIEGELRDTMADLEFPLMEREREEFHKENTAFEQEYYKTYTWHNWPDYWKPSSLHIGQVPDDVTDDWLRVCVEACQAYLVTPNDTVKLCVSFDYSGVKWDEETGEQLNPMRRRMDPWHSQPKWEGGRHKHEVAKILERLFVIAWGRGILLPS
jgi:hypothetical protein